jgi:hypothetical protein
MLSAAGSKAVENRLEARPNSDFGSGDGFVLSTSRQEQAHEQQQQATKHAPSIGLETEGSQSDR